VQIDKDSGSQGFAQPSCDVVKNAHERVSDTWFCGRWLGDDGERHGRLGLDLFDPNDGFAGRCLMQPLEGDTPPVGVDLNWRPQRVDLRRRWRWVAAGPGSRLPAIDRRVQNPDGSQCGGALDPPCGKRPTASIGSERELFLTRARDLDRPRRRFDELEGRVALEGLVNARGDLDLPVDQSHPERVLRLPATKAVLNDHVRAGEHQRPRRLV
jgi:hypothetical protein